VVHGPKPPLHSHNGLSFGKFQDTTLSYSLSTPRFVMTAPTSGETCKYATAPSTQKKIGGSLPIDMLLSSVFFLVVAQPSLAVPGGLMNYPV